MEAIKLDNNYDIKIVHDDNEIPKNTSDINKLKLFYILKDNQFILRFDFSIIKPNQYKKLLKKLLLIKKILVRFKKQIGEQKQGRTLIGYAINYDENDKLQNDFISGINAIFLGTRYERYNYIYDTVCDYLDSFFYGKNLCDFKNNQCGEKRLANSNSYIGCCHHYKIKILGPLISNNLTPCEHLKKDYTCGAKCIGCKLFTCDYLRKKGVRFKIKDILLLDTFFDPLQKYFIKTMVFTPKEQVIKRLMML